MAKIKVTSKCELYDGMSITFKAPCDGSAVDGLKVYYNNKSQTFSFRDAHGNNLAGLGNLFSSSAYIKAILNTSEGYAYLQNADTNRYLENHISNKSNPHGVTYAQVGAAAASHTHTKSQITDFPSSMPASDVYSWAKQSKKPSYTYSEVGAAAASHTHPASDIDFGWRLITSATKTLSGKADSSKATHTATIPFIDGRPPDEIKVAVVSSISYVVPTTGTSSFVALSFAGYSLKVANPSGAAGTHSGNFAEYRIFSRVPTPTINSYGTGNSQYDLGYFLGTHHAPYTAPGYNTPPTISATPSMSASSFDWSFEVTAAVSNGTRLSSYQVSYTIHIYARNVT